MTLRSRYSFALHVALGAVALYTVPWLIGAASAATGDAPVPLPTPDALMAYVQNYGWIVGGLTVVYLCARWLLKKNESTHWLAQGRSLAIVTTLIGVGGTALQAYTTGTPWSGVLATAVLGLLHLADPTVAGKQDPTVGDDPPKKATTRGVGTLVVLLLGGLTVTQTGCLSSATERASTLSAAMVTLDASAKAFELYDGKHTADIAAKAKAASDGAKTPEDAAAARAAIAKARADLAAYQAVQAKVQKAFATAYSMLIAAGQVNDQPSMLGAQAALKTLTDLVTQVTK